MNKQFVKGYAFIIASAVIFGLIFLNDKLNTRETIGCVIMFTAILLTQIPAEKFSLKKK